MSGVESHYAVSGIEERILDALRTAGFNLDERIAPEALAALDHFHTGGLRASHELMELGAIGADDRVLEIGAGLGGAARMLASERDCRVDCLELSADYCTGAELLNRLTHLDTQIVVHCGSALDIPFDSDTFDVVWMQNVGMNIADKQRLYEEVFRVLRPGGRYAFQEMAAGTTPTNYFPLPWATDPADSCLIPVDEVRDMLTTIGFTVALYEDTSDAHLNRKVAEQPPTLLTLRTYVDNLGEKAANAKRSLEEGQVRLIRGVFRKG